MWQGDGLEVEEGRYEKRKSMSWHDRLRALMNKVDYS